MRDRSQIKKNLSIAIAITIGLGTWMFLSHWFSGDKSSADVNHKRNTLLDTEVVDNEKVDLGELFLKTDIADSTATELAESMGMTMEFEDPMELVDEVMQKMSRVDSERGVENLAKTLGNGEVNVEELTVLKKLFAEDRIQLREENAIELLGEVKAGKASRWNLHLNDDSKIQLQTTRQKDGTWKIEEVRLPLSNTAENGKLLTTEEIKERDKLSDSKDALIFSSNFIKELIGQNFEKARTLVNNDTVSDAKIAGLCILFEDGAYSLNKTKPLQAVRMRDEIAAFYVNVDAKEGSKAQFALTTIREGMDSSWLINEINLDRLLDDYAKRIAGGDVYYTPLVKKPNGGDMLVIYFDFDSNRLSDRTKKQLNIVINLLQLDTSKKIRLSGHTDSTGSDDYNQGLSQERALAVKEYLIQNGIHSEQVITEAHGYSKPIRVKGVDANVKRANRRTEVYLDF